MREFPQNDTRPRNVTVLEGVGIKPPLTISIIIYHLQMAITLGQIAKNHGSMFARFDAESTLCDPPFLASNVLDEGDPPVQVPPANIKKIE